MQGNKFYFENDSLVRMGADSYKRIGMVAVGDRIWIDYNVTGVVAKVERMTRHDMVRVNTNIVYATCSKNCELYTTRGYKQVDKLNAYDTHMNFCMTGHFLPGKKSELIEEDIHCTYLLIACDEVYSESIMINNFKFRGNCFDAIETGYEVEKRKPSERWVGNIPNSTVIPL